MPTRILFTFAVLVFVAPQLQADVPLNELTVAEKKSGWKLLFDGKSTAHWRNYKQDKVSDGWAVEDGAIVWARKRAGDIITKQQFEHFELQLEYRISKGGNSGLMFHVTEELARPWQTGPEIQIQDNVDGHDPQKSGWLYQLYKPQKPGWAKKFEAQVGYKSPEVDDATRPAGEWNHMYLRVVPGQGEVCVNGVSYYKFQKGTKDWDARVAKSKFKNYARFGKPTKGHICLQDHGNNVAFRNIKVRVLDEKGTAPNPIDGTMKVKAIVAFPDISWEGYEPVDAKGRPQIIRPIELLHASDGTGRIFVANQSGMIHVLPTDSKTKKAKLFLDIRKKVHQWRVDDEEGLLGIAFHPDYKKNGYFFLYYSNEGQDRGAVVVRYSTSDDPDKANPDSEVILMNIQQPFSNHNGGPMTFGHDGYLYIAMGDGGGRNDPERLGQKLDTFMGSVMRIDVDKKEGGKNYGIPKDNPFLNNPKAKPELYAYGLRNVWRISTDPKTGRIWIGDVGQDLWEEIDILQKGANYGWSVREGTHRFGNAPEPKGKLVDPIWEYDHRIGKSITGGRVYRGSAVPELDGMYLYADYISGKVWALEYDEKAGKVTRNMAVPWNGLPVVAFGQDEAGEVYLTTPTASGKGIYRLVKE
jgi:glucose/arabinose dehydrogenase